MQFKKKMIAHPGKFIKAAYHHLPYIFGSDTAPPPGTIFLVINSFCNLHCRMCDVGQKQKGTQFFKNMVKDTDEWSLDELKRFIDDVQSFNPIIAITSTEPLLHKNIIAICEYIKRSGLFLQLTTNGYLLEQVSRDLVKSKVDEIFISLDGPERIHNYIRGNDYSYQKAVAGISAVNDWKMQLQMSTPRCKINYSISNYNYHCLIEFLENVKDLDIEHITFSHLNFITREMARKHNALLQNIYRATPSSISSTNLNDIDIDVLSAQISMAKKYYQNISFVPDLREKELFTYYKMPEIFLDNYKHCIVPWRAAQVLANGDLAISTRCYHLDLGNVHQYPFLQLWNGPLMKKFRKDLRNEHAFPACSRCCGLF